LIGKPLPYPQTSRSKLMFWLQPPPCWKQSRAFMIDVSAGMMKNPGIQFVIIVLIYDLQSQTLKGNKMKSKRNITDYVAFYYQIHAYIIHVLGGK